MKRPRKIESQLAALRQERDLINEAIVALSKVHDIREERRQSGLEIVFVAHNPELNRLRRANQPPKPRKQ